MKTSQNSYIPVSSKLFTVYWLNIVLGLKLDILPYKSNGKYGSRTTVKYDKEKTIGKLITERPESVNLRLNDNDYEMDTVIGLRIWQLLHSYINQQKICNALLCLLKKCKSNKENLEKLIKDNNLVIDMTLLITEVEIYKLPEIESTIKEIFHCHPYSSSEKGSIEMLTCF